MKHQGKKLKPSAAGLTINRRPAGVDTSEWPALPVFTAARLVCREQLHVIGDSSVLREIDSFLDEVSGSWSFSTAYKVSGGSLRLLQYLATHESKTKDSFLRRWDVNAVTGQAAARGDLGTLKWVAESYLPGEFLTENYRSRGYWGGVELAGALRNHHQHIVDWLRENVAVRPECAGYLIKAATECGNLGIVQWIYDNFELDLVDAFNAAVLKGQLGIILWFLDHAEHEGLDAALRDENVYMSPAEFGDLGMLKIFFGRGLVQEPAEVLEVAAGHGHLDIVKWLIEEQGIEDIGHAFDRAADHGHLDVLKYLRETKAEACIDSLLDGAAVAGYMGIVRWLHENTRARCTVQAMDEAAANGHLGIVQWLHANYTEGSINMDVAAAFGYLDVVQWFHETRDEGCTSWAMDRAAGNGELDVVKWLHEHRREGCTTDAMDDAASNGHLEVVKWLHDNQEEGCTTKAMDGAAANSHLKSYLPGEFLAEVVAEAASNGYLEILTWMWEKHHSRGFWGGVELAGAILNSHQHVVDWLRENVAVWPECGGYLIESAAGVGNLGIVQWLYKHFELGIVDAFHAAAAKGQSEVMLWFLDNAELEDLDAVLQHDSVCMSPAKFGDLDMLKVLFGRGLVREPVEVLEVTAEHGHLDIVKWLVEEKELRDIGYSFYLATVSGHLEVLT
ncbi:hypothetical protein PHYSODRAFT_334714 [Phytophthora sojae]|uniref:Ankyrin repeat-containing domain n=1 Tax=Phytophthora sojae (strain P6497) TaxID=1094619 RepID=G4ZTA7_PHYSP|nr:hypothetical protein PHYSODRAFT_334714 [Phytophthora sojae]EGZ12871.1 hypothetical protein PHYSODRAFT_334714 [Phytophthora sojae]|eukprot:XP_009530300.1 hypothetical protein PHYSODRAFT_334714 [Phytophthora sojae]